MSRTISFDLKAEMSGALSTLATCMKITRVDGTVFGFTTYDKALTIDGTVYEPGASFNPSDIESSNNMEVDNLSVEGMLSSDTITEEELRAGYWDYAYFQIFQVNWQDLTMGDVKQRAGRLGEVSAHRQTFVVELLGLMDSYSIGIVQLTTPMCRANLGDARCKVDLEGSPGYKVTGTIKASDTDFFTLHDTDRTEPDAFFDEGKLILHYPQGDLPYEVKAYVQQGSPAGAVWITKTPYAYDATDVPYTMYAGCNRTLAMCQERFNNVVNFRGEPWLRGNDVMNQIGRHKEE